MDAKYKGFTVDNIRHALRLFIFSMEHMEPYSNIGTHPFINACTIEHIYAVLFQDS